jgi:hypothetical protein
MKLTFNNGEIEIKYNGDRRGEGIKAVDILAEHQKQLICALNTRMYHCTKQVLDNITNITYIDDYIICYGEGQHYSDPAMQTMKRGVEMLRDGQYMKFLQDGMCVTQATKALYSIESKFPELMNILVDAIVQARN